MSRKWAVQFGIETNLPRVSVAVFVGRQWTLILFLSLVSKQLNSPNSGRRCSFCSVWLLISFVVFQKTTTEENGKGLSGRAKVSVIELANSCVLRI